MTVASIPNDRLADLDLVSPEKYAAEGYPHAEWTRLRAEAPVYWYDRDNVDPFWAVTKHADIVEIGKRRDLLIKPRLAVFTRDVDNTDASNHLLTMDSPEHERYRRVTSKWFTPRTVQKWAPEVERLTKETLDGLRGDRALDFVAECSAPITIAVIAEMLGLPREDWRLLFKWTNEIIAPEDPEFRAGRTAQETNDQARTEVFDYFANIAEQRRREPQDDILSVIVHGQVGGKPIPTFELLSYYFLLVVAGNETTRNAMTGGILAFLEHPEQWQRLRDDPSLVEPAVEEIVRWTTPVIQFCRTATQNFELRGQAIEAGASLCLFYGSGNRDEEIYRDPFAFRIDRAENDHLGFGRGLHVCLGAHLARLELRTMFRQLRERVRSFESAGRFERVHSSFVGGIKRAPIRWNLD